MKLWEYIKSKMLVYPKRIVCENHAEMTYEDLVVYAEMFAKELKGIQCCAILCRSEMAASMALLGCFAGGVTALPLSYRYGTKHSIRILRTISPDAIITDFEGEFQITRISDSEYVEPNNNHPALIMCTSGTTGIPKGVMLTEKNIMTNVSDISRYFRIGKSDSILITRSLHHCAVLVGEFLTGLAKGTTIRFYSEEFNPSNIIDLIKEYKITTFCGTPTMLKLMAWYKRDQELESLKTIFISGECMDSVTGKSICKAFPNVRIYHGYGLTEACPRVSCLAPGMFSRCPDRVGKPLHSVSLKIVKDNGCVADNNEIGILWVKGDNVMAGYYNDPERTKSVLQDGWLCTGDLAMIDHRGMLVIKGRADDLIIKAGMNIYPQEIENALKEDSRVREIWVRGEHDNKYGTQIVASVVGDFNNIDQVKKLCVQQLPSYEIPNKIYLVTELPKNEFGKMYRRKEDA